MSPMGFPRSIGPGGRPRRRQSRFSAAKTDCSRSGIVASVWATADADWRTVSFPVANVAPINIESHCEKLRAFVALRSLADRGYGVSKTLGLLLLA